MLHLVDGALGKQDLEIAVTFIAVGQPLENHVLPLPQPGEHRLDGSGIRVARHSSVIGQRDEPDGPEAPPPMNKAQAPGSVPVTWAFVVQPAGGRGRFRTADICFVSLAPAAEPSPQLIPYARCDGSHEPPSPQRSSSDRG
ncbi:hypothetical protein SNE510_05900 [Streptomyces sp. NE5-10]|nr:hypothetical protein SNE510_05900 [Streptomyces sp. NE5-10]